MSKQFTYGFFHSLDIYWSACRLCRGIFMSYSQEKNILQQFLYLMIAVGVPLLCPLAFLKAAVTSNLNSLIHYWKGATRRWHTFFNATTKWNKAQRKAAEDKIPSPINSQIIFVIKTVEVCKNNGVPRSKSYFQESLIKNCLTRSALNTALICFNFSSTAFIYGITFFFFFNRRLAPNDVVKSTITVLFSETQRNFRPKLLPLWSCYPFEV